MSDEEEQRKRKQARRDRPDVTDEPHGDDGNLDTTRQSSQTHSRSGGQPSIADLGWTTTKKSSQKPKRMETDSEDDEDDPDATTSNVNPKKIKNRLLWAHFKREKKKRPGASHRRAVCQVDLGGHPCGTPLKRSDASTTGMRQHLRSFHPAAATSLAARELQVLKDIDKGKKELEETLAEVEEYEANRLGKCFST